MFSALIKYGIPLAIALALTAGYCLLEAAEAHGAELQPRESISAMFCKLGNQQCAIATHARESYDLVPYGRRGAILEPASDVTEAQTRCLAVMPVVLNLLAKLPLEVDDAAGVFAHAFQTCQNIHLAHTRYRVYLLSDNETPS